VRLLAPVSRTRTSISSVSRARRSASISDRSVVSISRLQVNRGLRGLDRSRSGIRCNPRCRNRGIHSAGADRTHDLHAARLQFSVECISIVDPDVRVPRAAPGSTTLFGASPSNVQLRQHDDDALRLTMQNDGGRSTNVHKRSPAYRGNSCRADTSSTMKHGALVSVGWRSRRSRCFLSHLRSNPARRRALHQRLPMPRTQHRHVTGI